MELDNKAYVINRLKEDGRPGMDDLIQEMEALKFFNAPCSGGNHLCCEFGLVQHTRNVMISAENIGYALLGKDRYMKVKNSVMVAAALHDLGKCGDFGKELYTVNMIKNKKYKKTDPDAAPEYIQSDAKPYERNKDLTPIPHGYRSAIIAERWIDLTEEEEFAIMYHDGLFEPSNSPVLKGVEFSEHPLLLIIHWADMWACNIVENKKKGEQ